MVNIKNISVIGLGKLGAPLTYFLASKGFNVYGYDVDKKIRNLLKNKKNIYEEKNLQNYINKFHTKVVIEDNIEKLINKTQVTFVILPTPSKNNGFFDNSYIISCLKKITKLISRKKKKHLINITSTVMPGSCNDVFLKILKKSKSKIHLVYNPHFIALGSVLNDMENPDLLLLGTDEHAAKKIISRIYNKVYKKKNKNFFSHINLYEAEIAKICVNSFVTFKISFSNFVSNIVQSGNKKAQANNILSSISKDTRIGNKYLSVGANFSGPCFPRDNIALSKYCSMNNISNCIPVAIDKENNIQQVRYLNFLRKICKKNKIYKPKIGIIGLSYKSNSNVIEKSPGIQLIKMLKKKYQVSFYDPYCRKELIEGNINGHNNFGEHLENNDLFFLCYRDDSFKITDKIKRRIKKNKYIIDLWDFYKFEKIGKIKIFNIHNKFFI